MKKVISMILVVAMLACVLAACGTAKPAEDTAPAAQPAGTSGDSYKTTIKGSDVTITLNADKTEASLEVMGMILEAAVEVKDNVLTLNGKISGNDQIWSSVAGKQFTLHADGTAVEVSEEAPAEATAAEDGADILDEYTTTVKGNDVKFTLNENRDEVAIEVMGMIVEAAVEINGNKMTMKGKISGNDQIWNGFAGAVYTLNSDGTAVAD